MEVETECNGPPAKRAKSTKWGKVVTTLLVNASAIMERLDEQLLPSVYAFVAASFDISPTQLGTLTQCRAAAQAICSPLGGIAGYYYNRTAVILSGCLIWGIMTALFAGATEINQAYVLWAFNGLGLALVVPTGQSMIADLYSEESRGKAFGTLYLTGALGAMAGSFYGTNMGGAHFTGLEGWRVAFLSVALVSILVGALNMFFAHDPGCSSKLQLRQTIGSKMPIRATMKEMRKMFCIPTFLIIVTQGIVGALPWNGLVFLTLYLQTIGMSDRAASIVSSLFLLGTALGGQLGGYIGDRISRRHQNGGRIAACQFSVFAGVPFSFVLLKCLPMDGETTTTVLYAVVLSLMGLCISWAAPSCNNPIFAEIVPHHLHTMIYAFDRSFETALASSAAPLVGLLAEKAFGWKGNAAPSREKNTRLGKDPGQDLKNAAALGNALLVFMAIPWFLCGVFYSGLYWTYPRDRETARDTAAKAGLGDPRQALPGAPSRETNPLLAEDEDENESSPSTPQEETRRNPELCTFDNEREIGLDEARKPRR